MKKYGILENAKWGITVWKTKRRHHYYIREGSILEGLLFAWCLVGVIGILIYLGQ